MSPETGIDLDAIKIPLSSDISILISTPTSKTPETGLKHIPGLPADWAGTLAKRANKKCAIKFFPAAFQEGRHGLVLYEIQRYLWAIKSGTTDVETEVTSSLKGHRSTDWTEREIGGALFGEFRVINYLGSAWIKVNSLPTAIEFDVISRKLDFEGEYRRLVQSIAEHCQQLLLEWGSPTSLSIALDPTREKQLLLEQFLFLRNFLGSDKLDYYLEAIERHTHATLVEERKWAPAGFGSPHDFLANPVAYGRDWVVSGKTTPVPGQISNSRKYETNDTPPNQFIYFAIESFVELCNEVIERFGTGKPSGTAVMEAIEMRNKLDAFLLSPFFRGVGRMRVLPLQSQTLQKRQGYKQLLQAWILLDAASRLDWLGREDAYDGTNRDVATFYEFWLFFELHKLIKELPDVQETLPPVSNSKGNEEEFVVRSKNGLHINLKQGRKSVCKFSYSGDIGQHLSIHLYYNRTFSVRKDSVNQAGSYSRPLRPDFSLVIFPASFSDGTRSHTKAEERAEKDGQITYLHFDAKFRADSLEEFFGGAQDPKNEKNDTGLDEYLDEEKSESTTRSIYKRGDLYKMHAYNDAIRRTAGSYVLFPGSGKGSGDQFKRFHEILPGVGAFAIRPTEEGEPTKGVDAVGRFIKDVLDVQKDKFSQYYRTSYWVHQTVKEKRARYDTDGYEPIRPLPPADTNILLARLPNNFKVGGLKLHKLFFFEAIDETGVPLDISRSTLEANCLVPFSDNYASGLIIGILGFQLLSRQELLLELGEETALLSSLGTYFYRTKLEEFSDFPTISLEHISELGTNDLISTQLDSVFENRPEGFQYTMPYNSQMG